MSWFQDPALQEPTTRLVLLVASIAASSGNVFRRVHSPKTTFEWIVRRIAKELKILIAKILMRNPEQQDDRRTILKEIYHFLGILDSKAQGLMRYDGIILAVIALMIKSGSSVSLRLETYFIVYMTLHPNLVPIFVGVFWRFLEWSIRMTQVWKKS